MYISVLEANGFGGVKTKNQALACNKNRRVTNEFDHRLKARMLFFSYGITN